jgi:DNA-binding CsgD family transcriptional regulator
MATSLLSDREIQIINKIAEGLTTEEISQDLKLSPLTVKTHRKNILKKVGARNTPHLVNYAWTNGFIDQ